MSQLSERYALSLYEVCLEKKNVESTLDALSALAESLETHDDVNTVLTSPLVSNGDKVSILNSALKGHMSDELKTFIELLAKNNRVGSLPEIAKSFSEIVEKASGIMTGEVTSAVTLSDSEKTEIQKSIESKLGHKVQLKFNTNDKMIGGIEAKVGSYLFEDSIKSHMQKLNDYITRRVQ